MEDKGTGETSNKEKEELEGTIQRWKYYGLYLALFPVIFINIVKWIIMGKIEWNPLLVDYLLFGFSFAVTVFGIIADEYEKGENKVKLRQKGFRTALGGFVFVTLHIICYKWQFKMDW